MDGALAYGHDQTTLESYHEAAAYFARRLKEETGYRVEIFPDARCGTELAMIQRVLDRSLDLVNVTAANAARFVPELGLFSVSFLFEDAEHVRRVIKDEAFTRILDATIALRQPGLVRLASFTPGPRNLYTRRGSITSLADLKGLTMRVMASPVEAEVWRRLGTIPKALPFGEIHGAMARGEIDAADDTIAIYAMQRHFEVAPYHILTEHQWSLGLLLTSRELLDSLPTPVRKAMTAIGREMADHVVAVAVRLRRDYLDKLRRSPAVTLRAIDTGLFKERLADLPDRVAADLAMQEALQRMRVLRHIES